METPSWLNQKFVEDIFQEEREKNQHFQIISFTSKSALPPGENYTSNIFRIKINCKINGSTELRSVIVKAPLTVGILNDLSDQADFYCREQTVYRELLPKMQRKVDHEFGPKSFNCTLKGGLVVQDLAPEGYVMCDKHKQLDYSHCKLVYKTIAKYHAASVACYHDNPTLIEKIGEEIGFNDEGPLKTTMKLWLESSIKSMAEAVNKLGNFKEFENLLLSKVEDIWDSAVKLCKPKSGALNVLNHGDFWTNNMLFKHNEAGEAMDVKLIDFQVGRYASPAIDLLYFMWTSANEDVRENHQDELFQIYLKTLNKTLEQLGCEERMTSEQFQKELKLYIDWGIIAISLVLPFIMCQSEDVVSLTDFTVEDFENGKAQKRFQKMYSGKRLLSTISSVAKQYVSRFSK